MKNPDLQHSLILGLTLVFLFQNLGEAVAKPCQGISRALPKPLKHLGKTCLKPHSKDALALPKTCQNLCKILPKPCAKPLHFFQSLAQSIACLVGALLGHRGAIKVMP